MSGNDPLANELQLTDLLPAPPIGPDGKFQLPLPQFLYTKPPRIQHSAKPSSQWPDVRDELAVKSAEAEAERKKRQGLVPLVFE